MQEIRPQPEIGFDVPAALGMQITEVTTPCLVVDFDALECNLQRMGEYAKTNGMRLRPHAKMHKSVDIARLQMTIGGATGICCQKVSEAEVFARARISDILVTNEVRQPAMIKRLAALPRLGSRIGVCVDDPANVAELSAAASKEGTRLDAYVEIDCGSGRCGASTPQDAVAIARLIDEASCLNYAGLQAYQGSMQHIEDHSERSYAAAGSIEKARAAVEALNAANLAPSTVTGGGTGSYAFETASGLYNELQCGSYAFMDADYGRIRAENGKRLDSGEWQNALFLLTTIISANRPGSAVCDAGLKSQSVDSGLPLVHGKEGLRYISCADEHGIIDDPADSLKPGDRLLLIPGHCDPTCNLHDWYVGVTGLRTGDSGMAGDGAAKGIRQLTGVVATLWPVSARGKMW